ncbi:PREDICTED: uncharacterized protein LOC105143692 isoform X2 [Acromyrmex echinatior]|uniref:uncharacterized protein LOC105143692 isoform X2 n=1 Tax=Acromyrmex echinatior TaxID=103372 RepID=UPI000580C6F5|nr:PREDICTED: uncharacterized protein LOC105143692 isoform X2 [Acromyrmex echinatior]
MASDSSGRTNHSPRSVSSSLHSPILVYNPHEPVNSIPSTMDSKAPENLSDSQCDILNLFQSSPMDIDEIINSRKRPSSDRDVSQDSPLVTPPPRKNLLRLFPHLQIHKDRNNNNNRAKAVGHIAKVYKSQPKCLYCGSNRHKAEVESSCSEEGDKCINCKDLDDYGGEYYRSYADVNSSSRSYCFW